MAPNILRLRLTVRRHGVPDVKLVWPCDLTSDPTIAQLLTQINEVIPLESVEWGLEDYALELSDGIGGSFECLHFQTVASTLKAEDQIMIRPLMTDDIKQRKLGGRDQISRDGKHLLDGMAFGRRWLRAPRDRPMLDIPARKRARLTYPIEDAEDELLGEEEEEEEEENVVDEAEDEDYISNDDDNDSGSSTSEDVESEDFGSERSDEEDASAEGMDEELQLLRRDNADADEAKDTSRSGLLPTLDCVAALQIAFPLVSKHNLRTSFRRQGNDIRDTYEYLKKRNNANYTFDEMMDKAVMGVLDSIPSESESEPSNPRLLMPPRPLIQEVDEPDAPSTSVGLGHIDELVDAHISSDSDSETSSSTSSSSDSDDSDSDSDSDSESDESFKASSDSDSDDSSDSDSDSDNDSKVSEEPITKRSVAAVGQNPSMKSAPQVEKLVAPGSGLARTQKRNARRKLAKKMKRLEALGIETPAEAMATDPMDGIAEELAARKRALLESMSTSEHQSPVNGVSEESANAEPPSVETSRPRTRIDVGAGKRMLFGALGIKPPKSQDDENKIRHELMKDVRPVQNARLIQEVIEDTTTADDADDSWRENIVYRAVECCHEGIELSEPPFPFVQRWDPQQQYQPSKKRKRKVEYEDHQEELADDSYMAVGDDTAGELNYDDEPPVREPAPQADDDLPPLPHDVTALPGLEQHAVVPGMVITWKQLVMSKATNWQPELKGFTALVVSSKNDELQLTLAKRDRNGKRRQYDNETGQRIYDKFEAPDMDDDDDEGEDEDDGHRSLPWADLTDPRLLHYYPQNNEEEHRQETSEAMIEQGPSENESQMPCAQPVPHLGSLPVDDVFNSITTDSWDAAGEGKNQTAVDVLENNSGTNDTNMVDQEPQNTSRDSNAEHTTIPSSLAAPSENGSVMDDLEPGEEPLHYRGRSISLGASHHDSIIPDTLLDVQGANTATGDVQEPVDGAMSSSPPMPTIAEIWSTATAMQDTQTSEMAPNAIEKVAVSGPNAEYEKAMRQFDNEESTGPASALFPNATQPCAPPARPLRSTRSFNSLKPSDGPSTPDKATRKKRKRKTRQSKKGQSIPEGSQIIQISSSPVQPGSAPAR